jgi:hypothetical protein
LIVKAFFIVFSLLSPASGVVVSWQRARETSRGR